MLRGYRYKLPETRAWVAAMTAKPPDWLERALDDYMRTLKVSGAWDRIDIGYVHALHAQQAARINFKNPGSFTLTEGGSPTWTQYQGYTGTGVAGDYLDTGYDPSAASIGMGLDDAHGAVFGMTTSSDGDYDLSSGTGIAFRVRTRDATLSSIRINTGTATSFTTGTTMPGFIAGVRSDASNQLGYANGVLDVTGAVASTTLSPNIYLLGNAANPANRQIALAHVGRALSAAQVKAASDAAWALLRQVGAVT